LDGVTITIIMPHIIFDKQRSTCLRCFLYDKTKGAQYAQIIEEDDEARVKLLYDKTKDAQYALIIKEDNEPRDTTIQGVQYYLNN
jgi:hypothetical protein